MSAYRDTADPILGEIDWWYCEYHGSACPQSHLARELDLDLAAVRTRLDALVAAGVLEWRPSGMAGVPDARRTLGPSARAHGWARYKYKTGYAP